MTEGTYPELNYSRCLPPVFTANIKHAESHRFFTPVPLFLVILLEFQMYWAEPSA